MDTLDWHGVVEGGAASTDGSMSLKVDEVGGGALSEELGLKGIVLANSEGNINAGSVLGHDAVHIVAFGGVDVVIKESGSLGGLGLHGGKTTLLEHVGDVESAHVDGPA